MSATDITVTKGAATITRRLTVYLAGPGCRKSKNIKPQSFTKLIAKS
jgi:hypothetical protein